MSLLESGARVWSTATVGDVKNLLLKNPDEIFSTDDLGNTPLHLAVACNAAEKICTLLAKSNSSLCLTPNAGGRLPLHLAAQNGHFSLIPVLAYCEPKALVVKNGLGNIPLETAKRCKHYRTVDVLKSIMLSYGFTIGVPSLLERSETWVDTCPADIVAHINCDESIVRTPDRNGFLPIHLALHWGAPVNTLMALVEAHVVSLLDPILQLLWKHARPSDVTLLLEKRPDAAKEVLDPDVGDKLLSLAIKSGTSEATALTLLNANVLALLGGGELGWQYATIEHVNNLWSEISKDKLATPYSLDKPLQLAAKCGAKEDVVLHLIYLNPRACEAREKESFRMPLHLACKGGFTHLIPSLLAFFPSAMNALDCEGNGPFACNDEVTVDQYLNGLEDHVISSTEWFYCLLDGIPASEDAEDKDSDSYTARESTCSTARGVSARRAELRMGTARRLYFQAFDYLNQSDMHLVVGIGQNRKFIEAHSQVLKLRSPYFTEKIRGRWAIKGREIILKEMDPAIVTELVHYCHTGRVSKETLSNVGEELLHAATVLNVPALISIIYAYQKTQKMVAPRVL